MLFCKSSTTNKNLEERSKELFLKTEGIMEMYFRKSGYTAKDIFEDIDAETGALLGASVDFYNDAKNFTLEYSRAIDEIRENIEMLRKENKELREILEKRLGH